MREIEVREASFASVVPGWNAAGSRAAIKTNPIRNHEITVRLQDGSMGVITDANAARWRRGERIIIIAGVD